MHSDLAVHRCRAIKGWKIDGILALALNPSDTKLARAREGGYIDILHFPSLSHSMTILVNTEDTSVKDRKEADPFYIRSLVWQDEETFYTGGLDGIVRLWNATSGRLMHSFSSDGGPIWSMARHPDGRLAVACDNGHIRLFNRKNNLIGVLKGSGQRMLTCTWAVSSATTPSTVTLEDIWGASSDGNVYGWRIRAKSMAETLPSSQMKFLEPGCFAWSMAFSDAEAFPQLVTVDSHGAMTVWDIATRTIFQEIVRHQEKTDVICVAMDRTQSIAFTAGVDANICMFYKSPTGYWDFNGMKKELHTHDIWSLAISNTKTAAGYYVVSGGADCCIVRTTQQCYKGDYVPGMPQSILTVYPLPSPPPCTTIEGQVVSLRSKKPTGATTRLMLCTQKQGRQLSLYRLVDTIDKDKITEGPSLALELQPNLQKEILSFAISPDGKYIACSDGHQTKAWQLCISEEKKITLYLLNNEQARKTAGDKRKQESGPLPGAVQMAIGRNTLILATRDSLIQVFSLADLSHLKTFTQHTEKEGRVLPNPPYINSLKVSQDENWVVSTDVLSNIHAYRFVHRTGAEAPSKRRRSKGGARAVYDYVLEHDHKLPEFNHPVALTQSIPDNNNSGLLAIALSTSEIWFYMLGEKKFRKDWSNEVIQSTKSFITEKTQSSPLVGISARSNNGLALYSHKALILLSLDDKKTAAVNSFSLIFAISFLSVNELLLLEMPWKEFYKDLPDIISKPKFAT